MTGSRPFRMVWGPTSPPYMANLRTKRSTFGEKSTKQKKNCLDKICHLCALSQRRGHLQRGLVSENREEVDSDGLLRRSRRRVRIRHLSRKVITEFTRFTLCGTWEFLPFINDQKKAVFSTYSFVMSPRSCLIAVQIVCSPSLCLAVKKLWKERVGRPLHPNPWGQS